jgi:uncharacterized protein YerC
MPEIPAWQKLPPPLPDGGNPDMCSVGELEAKALHRFRYAQYLKQQHTIHFEQQVSHVSYPTRSRVSHVSYLTYMSHVSYLPCHV